MESTLPQTQGSRLDERHVLELLPKVYDELRRVAARQLTRVSAGCTLQPTALVHEVWLRLERDEPRDFENQAHFFASAAETMRNFLIDRARARKAIKRGSGQAHLDVDDLEIADVDDIQAETLIALSDAIDELAAEHAQMAELVKLRCFAGLRIDEAALALGVSRATANRWWLFARTWLYRELRGQGA